MNEVEREILDTLARVETKLDFHKEALTEYNQRIASLERKFWATLGAAILSVAAYLKSLFG
tara:strand:+ start:240 stop:422 length:183 start_codon:yes stop_codon:yes gene_type:complete